MSLKQWLNSGWLRTHKASKNEIENLIDLFSILYKNHVFLEYLDIKSCETCYKK
jgi:hypothetical protein